MPALILDGRKTRKSLLPDLTARFRRLSGVPTLAIVQVGERPDSTAFIEAKKKFAAVLGVNHIHIQLPESVSQAEVVGRIEECNEDPAIRGIIVQLPLPVALNRESILETIDPAKDVDGLTSLNVKRWLEGNEQAVMPATARGIRTLLAHHSIGLFQKKVTMVGRSMLVGKPIAAMCLAENATLAICHSKTPDLAAETSAADVVIVAAGKPGLVGAAHVTAGQVVIDVGISRIADGTLVGDVDFAAVSPIVSAISPVPGGVGPMTVFSLFENFCDLCERGQGNDV
jgi:methylenetetrahydrofolate dehydrogenase (NADP+)/methenyltetrahydrofolate cyclohydrolase